MKRRWVQLLLVAIFAWMATGGTFTCSSGDDDDHHHHKSGK
jgi:hypothetical protein